MDRFTYTTLHDTLYKWGHWHDIYVVTIYQFQWKVLIKQSFRTLRYTYVYLMRIYVLSTQTLMSTKLNVPNKNIHDRPKQILRPERLAWMKKVRHPYSIRFLLVLS